MMTPHLPTMTMSRRDFLSPRASSERVLVTVFLRGGADGLTLVPPTGDDVYYRERPTLAVTTSDTIKLNEYFSLNDALRPLMKYIDYGRLGIVHGCGSGDVSRSHFEAQDTMEHGGEDVGSGWLGRYMRARPGAASALSAVAIGTTRPESLRGAPGGAVMQSIGDFSLAGDDPAMLNQLEALYAQPVGELHAAARDTIAAVRRLRAIRANDAGQSTVTYPENNFARGLREIARLVKADVGLVASTIDLDGWDTHFVQSQLIGGLMRSLSTGVDAFVRDLGSLADRVDVLIMTEFGRRLRENSSFGTDHGAGGVMMLLGNAAMRRGLGGTVTSGFPDLGVQHRDEVGDIPSGINYRDVIAPVLQMHSPGIDIQRVFPTNG